jgi:hypothetical protein
MFWQQSNSEFRMALAENEEFTVPYGSSNDLKSKKNDATSSGISQPNGPNRTPAGIN